jgi:hypothetical protein
VSAEDSLARAEDLLSRLEDVRKRLEQTEDPDAALELLTELSELAKQVHAEIERAAREADAHA